MPRAEGLSSKLNQFAGRSSRLQDAVLVDGQHLDGSASAAAAATDDGTTAVADEALIFEQNTSAAASRAAAVALSHLVDPTAPAAITGESFVIAEASNDSVPSIFDDLPVGPWPASTPLPSGPDGEPISGAIDGDSLQAFERRDDGESRDETDGPL